MRHIVRPFFLSAFIATSLSVLIPLSSVHGCSCIPPAPPADALQEATAVFSGIVTHINRPSAFDSTLDPVTVTIASSEIWKGPPSRLITVSTAREEPSCGFGFQVGKEYLVYASGDPDALSVSLCSRTALRTQAAEDLAVLGAGFAPSPPPSVASPSSSSLFFWVSPEEVRGSVYAIAGAAIAVTLFAVGKRFYHF